MTPGLDLDTFSVSVAYFEQGNGIVQAPFQKVNLKAEHKINWVWSVGRLGMVLNKMCQERGNEGLPWHSAMRLEKRKGRMIKTLQN